MPWHKIGGLVQKGGCMYMAYSDLLKNIRDAARTKAEEIPKFQGRGCIRVTAVPCKKAADIWLGGLSDFDHSDRTEYEHVFSIVPGGTHTAIFNGERINTYVYSALKVAQCSLARKQGAGLCSGSMLPGVDNSDLTEENGWSTCYGALCVEIKDSLGEDFARIYISVSGADEEDDLKCAFAGGQAISKYMFLEVGDRFETKMPMLPF